MKAYKPLIMNFLVSKLAEHNNPLISPPWEEVGGVIDLELVMSADSYPPECGPATEYLQHLGRIKFFIENGWTDPIEVDVGVPVLGFTPDWMILDGNHRFVAALLLGMVRIKTLVGGEVDYAKTFCRVKS